MFRHIALTVALVVGAFGCTEPSLETDEELVSLSESGRNQASGVPLRALVASAVSVDIVRLGDSPQIVRSFKRRSASIAQLGQAIAQTSVLGSALLLVLVQGDGNIVGVPISGGSDESPGVNLADVEEVLP